MYEKTYPSKRFNITLAFLKKHIATNETIFDLGVPNPFSKIMIENGYQVKNTTGEDLDNNQDALRTESMMFLQDLKSLNTYLTPTLF